MEDLINGNLSIDEFNSKLGTTIDAADDDSINAVESETNDSKYTNVEETQAVASTEAETQAEPVKPDPIETESPKPTPQELISTALEELYIYEAELLSQLGEMKREAVAKINSGNGTKEQLISIGMEGLDKSYEPEVSADAKVKGVLDKLKSDLEDIGADSSITKELWEYYCDEKENTKTYYLNKYL